MNWQHPVDPLNCTCGCGEYAGFSRLYLPGHDQKHLTASLKQVTGKATRHEQIATLHQMDEDLSVAADALAELYLYLNSEKFHTDPTVQVADVLHRLSNASVAVAGYRSPKED